MKWKIHDIRQLEESRGIRHEIGKEKDNKLYSFLPWTK